MLYLLWSLPAIVVIGLVASGKADVLRAALAGTFVALGVALLAAPGHFLWAEASTAILRGAWIGWIVVPYILGGLLFWQIASRPGGAAPEDEAAPAGAQARRRLLFTACFLVGPFAESATGFGVGIIGTMALVRGVGVQTRYLLAFSLLSQTMILWGAMGSGVIVGAAFAGADATALALHSSLFVAALHVVWLPLFWRLAARAGVSAGWREHASEAAWIGAGLALAIGATAWLGPEIALLAAYGPLVVLRFLLDERPHRQRLEEASRRILPFAALIGGLVLSRSIPALRELLTEAGRLAPFPGAPAWSPLFHAGTWLVAGGIATALARGHGADLPREMKAAWRTGRLAVLTIILFSMMAEVLSVSGIAAALARGLSAALGPSAVMMTPFLAGTFGAITNSGNAANGLFMASQVTLATAAGLNLPAVVALQHISGLTMSMFSPVRMAIVCSLAGAPGQERLAYRMMLPFAAAALLVLFGAAVLIAAAVI